jgi:hypothetical protein
VTRQQAGLKYRVAAYVQGEEIACNFRDSNNALSWMCDLWCSLRYSGHDGMMYFLGSRDEVLMALVV